MLNLLAKFSSSFSSKNTFGEFLDLSLLQNDKFREFMKSFTNTDATDVTCITKSL